MILSNILQVISNESDFQDSRSGESQARFTSSSGDGVSGDGIFVLALGHPGEYEHYGIQNDILGHPLMIYNI